MRNDSTKTNLLFYFSNGFRTVYWNVSPGVVILIIQVRDTWNASHAYLNKSPGEVEELATC